MKKIYAPLLILLTLVSVGLSVLCLSILPRLSASGAQPFQLLVAIVLSFATSAYCIVELVRLFRGVSTLLPSAASVLLVCASLVASWFGALGHAPYPRHADTTHIPELELQRIDAAIATPTPTPR
jgi:hypothetical protein